jgi:hypothetical protein
MSSIIKELWIFSNDGIPIVEITVDTKLNKYLMGSFISAIKTYSQHLSENGGLNCFIMENCKFTVKSAHHGNSILVCKTDSDIKEKKITKVCDVIARIFEELYDVDDIQKWNGDLAFFDKFKEKLDLYFKMSNL